MMAEFTGQGALIDLSGVLDADAFKSDYAEN